MNLKIKVAVIGGGASGLFAAVAVSRRIGKGSTVIIERQSRTGRKLLATGNGRCNISNYRLSAKNYHGDKKIINSVLNNCSPDYLIKLCSELGLLLRKDSESRLYPYSNKASTVLDCLRNALETNNVKELCDTTIESIKREHDNFIISCGNTIIYAKYVIIATGSPSAPYLGSDDSGYKLLNSLCIKHTSIFPSLSSVPCSNRIKSLKGVRAKGEITLTADNSIICKKTGEIQFTENGLSGICVFDLSRYINEFFTVGMIDRKKYKNIYLTADLMPEYSEDDIFGYIKKCRKLFSHNKAADLLGAALDKKISAAITERLGYNNLQCNELNDVQLRSIAKTVKDFRFTPEKAGSFESSQVCAGGFDSSAVYPDTLMSRKINNLFICGELLDVDGECGGYNLHFAIGSAITAANYIK